MSKQKGEYGLGYDTPLQHEHARIKQERDELLEALRPFTQEGLLHQSEAQKKMGDDAPVYGREKAILTHGHFRKAADLLSRIQARGVGVKS